MLRRDALARIGIATTVGGLAGCLGTFDDAGSGRTDGGHESADDPAGADGATGETDPSGTARGDASGVEPPAGIDSDDEEPVERYVIDDVDRDVAHVGAIWNASPASRALSLVVRRGGEPVLETTETLPADGYLEVVVGDETSHELIVESDGSRAMNGFAQSTSDCQRSTVVVIFRDGGVESRSQSRTPSGRDCE